MDFNNDLLHNPTYTLAQLQSKLRQYENKFMGGSKNISARRILNGIVTGEPWAHPIPLNDRVSGIEGGAWWKNVFKKKKKPLIDLPVRTPIKQPISNKNLNIAEVKIVEEFDRDLKNRSALTSLLQHKITEPISQNNETVIHTTVDHIQELNGRIGEKVASGILDSALQIRNKLKKIDEINEITTPQFDEIENSDDELNDDDISKIDEIVDAFTGRPIPPDPPTSNHSTYPKEYSNIPRPPSYPPPHKRL